MKNIIWTTSKFTIKFEVNWLEFMFLKNIFKQKRAKIIKDKRIKGRTAKIVVVDEMCDIDWDKLKGGTSNFH